MQNSTDTVIAPLQQSKRQRLSKYDAVLILLRNGIPQTVMDDATALFDYQSDRLWGAPQPAELAEREKLLNSAPFIENRTVSQEERDESAQPVWSSRFGRRVRVPSFVKSKWYPVVLVLAGAAYLIYGLT